MKKRIVLFFALLQLLIVQPGVTNDQLPAPKEGYVTSFDGTRIFYKVVGDGPDPVVVVHGGPGNTLLSILPDLVPLSKNRTVIYYDQRGNGRSELNLTNEQLAIPHHVKDLEALRRHFKLKKMTLIGNSWGGLLVGFYALEYPDKVDKLILHSPASPSYSMLRTSTPYIHQRIPPESQMKFQSLSVARMWTVARDPLSVCKQFYNLLRPVYFSDVTKAERMRGDVCAGSINAVRRQLVVNKAIWESLGEWDLTSDLKTLTMPALIIHGSYDMIPLESSISWVENMLNARLLVIEDSGHMTHIEQPDIFFNAVEKFLSGGWPDNAINYYDKNLEIVDGPINISRP